MAALAAPRKTQAYVRPSDHFLTRERGGTQIFHGSLVADLAGVLVPASADVNQRVIGRASCDNGISADVTGEKIRVDEGVFRWVAGDTIDGDDIGEPCYADDDQTVFLAIGTRPFAGIIVDFDANGVWVDSSLTLSGLVVTP